MSDYVELYFTNAPDSRRGQSQVVELARVPIQGEAISFVMKRDTPPCLCDCTVVTVQHIADVSQHNPAAPVAKVWVSI